VARLRSRSRRHLKGSIGTPMGGPSVRVPKKDATEEVPIKADRAGKPVTKRVRRTVEERQVLRQLKRDRAAEQKRRRDGF
jgi:hypothetical protein